MIARNIQYGFWGLLLLLLQACSKDSDIFVPDPVQADPVDSSWKIFITDTMPVSVLERAIQLNPSTDTQTVQFGTPTVFVTADGIQVRVDAGTLTQGGGTVATGLLQAQIYWLKKKGDFIRAGVSTQNSAGELLRFRSATSLNILKGSNSLQLLPGNVASVTLPMMPNSEVLSLQYRNQPDPLTFSWMNNPNPQQNFHTPGTLSYQIQTQLLGWMGLARPVLMNNSPARVEVQLPARFTNGNSAAWIMLQDGNTVCRMQADVAGRKFRSQAMPGGVPITVVLISLQQGQYYYNRMNLVTPDDIPGGSVQTIQVNPATISSADLLNQLNSL